MKAIDDPWKSNADKNLKWATKLADLTPKVEDLFAKWSRKHKAPSKEACRTFAIALMGRCARIDAAPLRQANIAAGIFRPDITPSLNGADKSARTLLRHLDPIRKRLADETRNLETSDLDTLGLPEHYNEKIELLNAAVEAVEMFLPVLNEPPLVPSPEGNTIRLVARKAQEAWAEANAGKFPTGAQPDGPLVPVVSGALALIGIRESPANVSMVLRGLRQIEGGTK
jgi:hypothetical protein